MGMNIGGSLSCYEIEVTNFLAVGCGQYGFTNASLFGGASTTEPVWPAVLANMHVDKGGWGTFFSGDGSGCRRQQVRLISPTRA
jgi:hypothetical protein